MKQYLLFDLDGTLTDPKVGITSCVQYALKDFGIDEPDLDKLEPFIGPPLKDSFMQFYGFSEEDAEKAVEKYRERFQDTGIFENELYGGIHDLLRSVKAGGMHLAVASSKPTVFVERILKHFKIDQYFEVVVGSELDGTRTEKAQVIHEALRQMFGESPIDYSQVYMIGDRKYDIQGARTFHIESIGVTYGYGTMEELKEAKADHIVESVAELKSLLMRDIDAVKKKAAQDKALQDPKAAVKANNKVLWKMFIPFAMFFVMRMVVFSLFTFMIQTLCSQIPPLSKFFVASEADGVITYTANTIVVGQILAFAAAAFFIRKLATQAIVKTADEVKHLHLKTEPKKRYVMAGVAVLSAAVGLNMMTVLASRMMESETAVTTGQSISSIILGFICYVVVIPAAEELLYRGVIYNCMRRAMKLPLAIVLSGFVYSAVNSNSMQQMYAFGVGCILAYAYEYFGCFYVPLAMQIGVSLIMYLMSVTGLEQTGFVNWPVSVIFLAVAVVGLFMMHKEKNIFGTKEKAVL